jgi:hypothetical protein
MIVIYGEQRGTGAGTGTTRKSRQNRRNSILSEIFSAHQLVDDNIGRTAGHRRRNRNSQEE